MKLPKNLKDEFKTMFTLDELEMLTRELSKIHDQIRAEGNRRMKPKEKMAFQYYQDRPEGFGNPTDDFLAGFEKALQLASAFVGAVSYESPEELAQAILQIGE